MKYFFMKQPVALVTICLLFLSPQITWAEDDVNEDPLHAAAEITPRAIPPGGQAQVIIDLSIDPPYKAYVDRFKLKSNAPDGVKVGSFEISPTIEFKDTFSGEMKKGIKKHATMKALIELPPELKEGRSEFQLALTYQACTEKHCLFPKTIPLIAEVDVNQSAELQATPTPAIGAKLEDSKMDFSSALQKGTFYAFLFVFLAGLLTSLTPCIFPMIPITLAILGTRTAGQSKLRSLTLSLSYVLGIALTYATLGVFAAKTGALFGSTLSNPWVVSAIAILFVAMGFSMYGAFEIQVPGFIRQRLGSAKTGGGYLGAFVTGLIAGLVASPCVGPVLVSILTYVAQTQNVVLGFWLLFTFALGLGVLFIVLGTSSSMVSRLPRAGNWMEIVKFVFGTAMIGMALYYIAPLAPQRLFDAFMGFALVSITSYYGAFKTGETIAGSSKLQWLKGLMLTGFVVGLLFILFATFGRLQMAAPGSIGASIPVKKLNWEPYSEAKLSEAAANSKPVIIDFFAEWCAACKELELLTFSKDKVQEEAKQFMFLKIDATEDSPVLSQLKKKYRVMGLPTLIFVAANGEVRWDLTLTGFEEEVAFLQRMHRLRQ